MAYVGFDKLVSEGVPPGAAANIGRKKYGKKKFQKAAAEGKKMKGMKPKKKGKKRKAKKGAIAGMLSKTREG